MPSKEYHKEYYAKNKEHIKQQTKEYREANKEQMKEYMKEYREANKECKKKYYQENKEYIKQKSKEYNEKNKEHIKQYYKKWSEENKEQIKEQKKEYGKTDQSKKSHRISAWKQMGLICEDCDKLYEHYINTWECDNCGIDLIEGKYGANHRCMDHNHRTGLFRNILCNTCNRIRPLYESD